MNIKILDMEIFSNKNYKLEECSENEIYNAIFSDDYYKLNFPKDMLIYHTKNHKICKHNDDWLRGVGFEPTTFRL